MRAGYGGRAMMVTTVTMSVMVVVVVMALR